LEGIDGVTTKYHGSSKVSKYIQIIQSIMDSLQSRDFQSIQVIKLYLNFCHPAEAFGWANTPQLRRHRDRLFNAENGPEEGAPATVMNCDPWCHPVIKSGKGKS